MVSVPIKVTIYDAETGKHPNRTEYYWRCEKIGFWVFLGTVHDEFHIIEEPDRKIGEHSYRGILTVIRKGLL